MINVAMFNIRVMEKYNGSSKELWSRMFEKTAVANVLHFASDTKGQIEP